MFTKIGPYTVFFLISGRGTLKASSNSVTVPNLTCKMIKKMSFLSCYE